MEVHSLPAPPMDMIDQPPQASEFLTDLGVAVDPARSKPEQGAPKQWVPDTSILPCAQMSFQQSVKRRKIHCGAAREEKEPAPTKSEAVIWPAATAVWPVPDDRPCGEMILIPGFHGAVVKVMIRPVMWKALLIDHSNIHKAGDGKEDPSPTRWMLKTTSRWEWSLDLTALHRL